MPLREIIRAESHPLVNGVTGSFMVDERAVIACFRTLICSLNSHGHMISIRLRMIAASVIKLRLMSWVLVIQVVLVSLVL
jgi:hypothetical protein